jgi:flagellar hook-length control protein FliK
MTIPAILPMSFSGSSSLSTYGAQPQAGGLFGAFFGDFMGTLMQTAGMTPAQSRPMPQMGTNDDPLLALLGLNKEQTLSDLPPELKKEDGSLDLNAVADKLFGDARPEGDVLAIRLVMIEIVTVVYTEANTLGKAGIGLENLTDTEALAWAYMKQGYSAEEATAKAERLAAIMALLDAQIERLKAMNAALAEGAAMAGYTTAALPAQDMPFGLGGAQMTYAAFRSVSVSTTTYTDLTARVLKGAPLVADAAAATRLAAATDGEAARGIDLLLPAATDDAPLDEGQLQQLVRSAERILEAVTRAEQTPAVQQALAAGTSLSTRQIQNALATEGEGAEPVIGRMTPEGEALPATNTPREAAAKPLRQQSVEVQQNIRPDIARTTPSIDAQTQPMDSTNATPVYKVETAPSGGMQLVNAQTGEVVALDDAPRPDTPRAATPDARMAELVAQAKVIQQVRAHVRTVANHGGGRIDVAITPPELGRVEVNLRIREGKVTGVITVQRPEVMEHLARELKVLEQGLADAGLSLSKEGLTFQMQGQGAQQRQTGDNPQTAQRGGGDTGQDDPAQRQTVWQNPDRLVDVNV